MDLIGIMQTLSAFAAVFCAPAVVAGYLTTKMNNEFKERYERKLEDHKSSLNKELEDHKRKLSEELEAAKLGFSKQLKDHENSLTYGLREHERNLEYRLGHAKEIAQRRYKVYDELQVAFRPFQLRASDIKERRPWFYLLANPDAFKKACRSMERIKPKAGWLGKDTSYALFDICDVLGEIDRDVINAKGDREILNQIAYDCWPCLEPLIIRLNQCMIIDFLNGFNSLNDNPTKPHTEPPPALDTEEPSPHQASS